MKTLFPCNNDWGPESGTALEYSKAKGRKRIRPGKRSRELEKLVNGTVILGKPKSDDSERTAEASKSHTEEATNVGARKKKRQKLDNSSSVSTAAGEQGGGDRLPSLDEHADAAAPSEKKQRGAKGSKKGASNANPVVLKASACKLAQSQDGNQAEEEERATSQAGAKKRLKTKRREGLGLLEAGVVSRAAAKKERKAKGKESAGVLEASDKAPVDEDEADESTAAVKLNRKSRQGGGGSRHQELVEPDKDSLADTKISSRGEFLLSGAALKPGKTQRKAAKNSRRKGSLVLEEDDPEVFEALEEEEEAIEDAGKNEDSAEKPASLQTIKGSSGLLEKMTARLQGSKFRWLNETMYTSSGEDAFALLQDQPELFDQYHQGFQQQTKSWPLQPVQVAISWLKSQPAELRVADFGCGDAALAVAVPQRVACLDLVAARPGVIACNMSDTPLETGSKDVAVFCLALMGTDYPSFLREAARVVKSGGRLWIAEVRSRFTTAGREDFQPFLRALSSLGFRLEASDSSNKMFVVFRLKKVEKDADGASAAWPELKPCMYKRR